ncbi:MAG: CapA family protein, partial [Butyrivibrio sp.]|nr:CapA family protein [Butyrivibrio sp.]
GGDMLVYYAIGNFVSWTSSSGTGVADRSVGGMAKVTLTQNPDGEVVIKDHSIRLLVCHNRSEEHGVTVYPLSEYSEDLANENEIRLKDSSFSRQYCIDLCNKIWGEGWE